MAEQALTPLAFLDRAERLFGSRVAVIDGDRSATYGEFAGRVRSVATALEAQGIGAGDVVAVLAPNSIEMLEAHYAIPRARAVVLALNTRLSPDDLSEIVLHAGARVLMFHPSLADLAGRVSAPRVLPWPAPSGHCVDRDRMAERVSDERDLIALNYTSGTTGRPKGAMYHHRGAYLQSLAMAYHAQLAPGDVHLWTLPMFHCSGWCFTWAVTAAGATHLCLPKVEAARIWRHLREDGVSQLNAAPAVLSLLASDAAASEGPPLGRKVRVSTGGAPPSPTLLARLEELGFTVSHLYGLTETFGPVIACEWQPEWDRLDLEQRASLLSRQGNCNIAGAAVRVVTEACVDVPADGVAEGEVVIRGENVMLGYYRDARATAEAFHPGGWFRTGDIAVMHDDGYLELRDRAKDVIISGGENIASIEVEHALSSHPAVLEVAVVSMPDERWGEAPLAYVALKPGSEVAEAELLDHARERLAGFKRPKRIVFGSLPKTGTGKIQKYVLRERAWEGKDRRVG